MLQLPRAFKMKYKTFFITFKGLPVTKNYIISETAPLSDEASQSSRIILADKDWIISDNDELAFDNL